MRYRIFRYIKERIGDSGMTVVKYQPEEGFDSYESAEAYLNELIDAKKGYGLDGSSYYYVILKTYQSQSAIKK